MLAKGLSLRTQIDAPVQRRASALGENMKNSLLGQAAEHAERRRVEHRHLAHLVRGELDLGRVHASPAQPFVQSRARPRRAAGVESDVISDARPRRHLPRARAGGADVVAPPPRARRGADGVVSDRRSPILRRLPAAAAIIQHHRAQANGAATSYILPRGCE